jgi:hypothetical protein
MVNETMTADTRVACVTGISSCDDGAVRALPPSEEWKHPKDREGSYLFWKKSTSPAGCPGSAIDRVLFLLSSTRDRRPRRTALVEEVKA